MRLCIVPMKPLAAAKARLAPVLTPERRRDLSLAMLADVVAAGRALDAVWVLQSDSDAAAVAARGGADARPDPAPGAGLNASLEAATLDAVREGFTGVLVLAADLALATADDALALAAEPGVAIAPSANGRGTNALWRSPASSMGIAFGAGSRAAHERLARAGGLEPRIVQRRGLALDVDSPDDLEAAVRAGPGPHTQAALARMGIAAGGDR